MPTYSATTTTDASLKGARAWFAEKVLSRD